MSEGFSIIRRMRKAGWLVTVKFMPKEFAYLVEEATGHHSLVCKGKIHVTAMDMRHLHTVRDSDCFGDDLKTVMQRLEKVAHEERARYASRDQTL